MRFGMVFALVAAMMAGAAAAEGARDRSLTVTGLGVVETVPDMAVVTVGANHRAETAEAAMAMVGETVAAILGALDGAGIEARDIQTSGVSLSPVYDHTNRSDEGPRLIGFAASNRVTVRLRALGSVGAVLGSLVDAGANDIQGVRFDLQAPRAAQDEARRRAVVDARAKAELFEEAAGVRLGRVLTITEHGGAAPHPEMMRTAAFAADAVPIAPGEVAISSQVQMVWELID